MQLNKKCKVKTVNLMQLNKGSTDNVEKVDLMQFNKGRQSQCKGSILCNLKQECYEVEKVSLMPCDILGICYYPHIFVDHMVLNRLFDQYHVGLLYFPGYFLVPISYWVDLEAKGNFLISCNAYIAHRYIVHINASILHS